MKKDIVKQYIDDYPQMQNRTLAKKICEDMGGTIEAWRTAIRDVRGVHGDAARICRSKEQEYWKPAQGRPYILILDIETLPMIGYMWGTYKQNISPSQLIEGSVMVSWSAKWLFESEIKYDVMTPKEALNRDDSRITKSIWDWVNKADIIVAHNGSQFDMPVLNTRFIIHGLKPPKPYQVIDTLRVIKSRNHGFKFSSNRLDSVCMDLGIPRKLHTDFSLWQGCMDGKQESLDQMAEYNRNDVGILEEVYVKLRPWIKSHPNIGLYVDTEGSVCPNCGNEEIEWDGEYYTMVSRYSAFRCKKCGAIGRSRVTELSLTKRKALVTTTAR